MFFLFTGGRLGTMQSLAGLAAVLSRFTVTPAEETQRELVPDPKSIIVQNVLGGVPLRFQRRQTHKAVERCSGRAFGQ